MPHDGRSKIPQLKFQHTIGPFPKTSHKFDEQHTVFINDVFYEQ